jgi:hypothetical protein
MRVAAALRLAASSLYHSKSALGAFHCRLKPASAPQGDHRDRPQARAAHLPNTPLRHRLRRPRSGVLRAPVPGPASSRISCAVPRRSVIRSPRTRVHERPVHRRRRREVTWKRATRTTSRGGRPSLGDPPRPRQRDVSCETRTPPSQEPMAQRTLTPPRALRDPALRSEMLPRRSGAVKRQADRAVGQFQQSGR